MITYIVKGQGYGGGGPSVRPFTSSNLSEIKDRIADLLETDHAVQLYRVDAEGNTKQVEFDYYAQISVSIEE